MFTFDQRPDASIYITSPSFDETKWLSIRGAPPALEVLDAPDSEKISVHGSGVVHIKSPVQDGLRLKGNYLLSSESQSLGVRHVLTCAPSEPAHIPASPAFNRQADVGILANSFKPYVFVFWAVPANQPISVEVGGSFQANDLETIPPESGFGSFSLRTHAIVWFAYRTKHMDRWPSQTYACFHDGFHAPFIIGAAEGEHRLELRVPTYTFSPPNLRIAV